MGATPPRRRWFQFRLKTMFVTVTVFALWLGWELRYIHERRETRKWAESLGCSTVTVSEWSESGQAPAATIPFWRQWLGNEAMHEVVMPAFSDGADFARINHVFPEARAFVGAPKGVRGVTTSTGAIALSGHRKPPP